MSFSLENLIIAIIAILPGFVSAAIRATLKPGRNPSTGEWIAASVVTSLVLNALAFALFIFFFKSIDLNKPLSEMKLQLSELTGFTVLFYLLGLYALALLWGFVTGLASDNVELRVLAYKLRLTPISPETSVFVDMLRQQIGSKDNQRLGNDPKRKVAWLRIRRDGKLILGRLRKSSIRFNVNDPIEIYLSPGYIFATGEIISRKDVLTNTDSARQLYLRLRPEDIAEILVLSATWNPLTSTSETETPILPTPSTAPWPMRFFSCRTPSTKAPSLHPDFPPQIK